MAQEKKTRKYLKKPLKEKDNEYNNGLYIIKFLIKIYFKNIW